MLESFNSDTKELCAMNKDMQTYIDSCKKERAAYLEHKNLHIETVANITVNIDSITP